MAPYILAPAVLGIKCRRHSCAPPPIPMQNPGYGPAVTHDNISFTEQIMSVEHGGSKKYKRKKLQTTFNLSAPPAPEEL